MPWVAGADVLAYVGATAPSQPDEDWADLSAAAVSAAIDTACADLDLDYPPDGFTEEVTWAAMVAAGEAWKRREAPFGVTGYADISGAAIRVARDYLETIRPILQRYVLPGIG
jgi:hypothetical protein